MAGDVILTDNGVQLQGAVNAGQVTADGISVNKVNVPTVNAPQVNTDGILLGDPTPLPPIDRTYSTMQIAPSEIAIANWKVVVGTDPNKPGKIAAGEPIWLVAAMKELQTTVSNLGAALKQVSDEVNVLKQKVGAGLHT